MPSALRLPVLLAPLALLASACSHSPSDVVEDLGEFAERRKLVQFRKQFSADSLERLRRRWREDGLTEAEGWLDLMVGYLGKDKEPPEVVGEKLKSEDVAVVKVAKELKKQNTRIVQDLTLVKEEDVWLISIGAMVYVEEDLETGEKKEPADELPLSEADDDWEMDDAAAKKKKKGRTDLKDFDLEEF